MVACSHGGTEAQDDLAGLIGAAPPPFAEVWLPSVRWAWREVEWEAGPAHALLADSAVAAMQNQLLAQLCAVSELALYERFDELRAAHGGASAVLVGGNHAPPRELYARFAGAVRGQELVAFFLEYSALGRQVCTVIDTWVAASRELLTRLRADRAALAAELGDGDDPGRVERLETGLSDRHHGGRQVVALEFSSGLCVIYKPRDGGLEHAYNGFVRWLAAAGLECAPRPFRTLPRPGYLWAERIGGGELRDEDDLRDYYRRAGALICVTYLLSGADLHNDNIVGGAGGPYLVDAEALVQPLKAAGRGQTGAGSAEGEVRSCLASGILSFPQMSRDGEVNDVGGLRGTGGHVAGTRMAWRHVNTDGMQPTQEVVRAEASVNVPRLRGVARTPEEFGEELLEGFSSAYRVLHARRGELLAADGPLSAFAGLTARLILRPSDVYAQVLQRLVSPKFQRLGWRAGLLIDSLNAPFHASRERPRLWPLVSDERRALQQLDVPYFGVGTSETVMRSASGEAIEGYIVRSGVQVVRDRAASLGEKDLARQLSILRLSLAAGGAGVTTLEGGEPAEPGGDRGYPWAEVLIRSAEAIAGELAADVLAEAERYGERTRAGSGRRAETDRWLEDFNLYGGVAGIALFLSALARVTGKQTHLGWARSALRPIREQLEADPEMVVRRHAGLGVGTGLGGMMYAFASIGRLLAEPDLIELGLTVASCLRGRRIRDDSRLDVEGGSAGAILGLLALHAATHETWLLEKSMSCARHLLTRRRPAAGGGGAWPGRDGLMLAGFAHGAAGISSALVRLHATTGEPALLAAAKEGRQYERGLFDQAARNWPVLMREEGGERIGRFLMTAWCHGAPGIALSRMPDLGGLDDDETRSDLEAALESTRDAPLAGLDHLCCGNLGIIDVLLTGGRVLGRGELVQRAWSRSTVVVRRAASAGAFSLPRREGVRGGTRRGLFQGSAGVGYQLLRLARPDQIPSVLAFALPAVAGDAGPTT